MIPIQLDLFKTFEQSEIDELRRFCVETKASSERVRKGMYAKLNELNKKQVDLEERLTIIERNICYG